MIDQISEALDACRSGFPVVLIAMVPVIMIVVSPIKVADAAQDFSVFRMQQYDLQGISYGCRSAFINSEARTLQSSSIARKCVIVRSTDFTSSKCLEILDRGPSSILVLLQANLTQKEIADFLIAEEDILRMEINIPVYFAHETRELDEIYESVSEATQEASSSALQALVNSASSVGYQLVTAGGQSKQTPDTQIINIQGILPGLGNDEQLPTIVLVAHYDSFGFAPHLSYGANSDASGVVALIELAKILSKAYSNSRTHPRYNVAFLLSGGGKFNYQGSRKYIEDGLDNTGSSFDTSVPLTSAKLVLCLEGLASGDGNALKMHVSKPPGTGTVAHAIHSSIAEIANSQYKELDTSIVHKKIRLSADQLAWEHERYSIRRLHAVTLSSLAAHDDPIRRSVMDTKDKVSSEKLSRNIQIIAEAIMRHIYNTSESDDFTIASGDFAVQPDHVQSWLNNLASQTRPAQAMHEDHPVITSLDSIFHRYLKNVQKVSFKADKRDPEFMFYDALQMQMSASIVRSAVFDLYMTGVVALYVATIYFMVTKFKIFLAVAGKFSTLPKVKVH